MVDIPGPGSEFTIDLSGTVIGEEGEFLANAVIKVNDRVASTDDEGIFRIQGLEASEGRNYLEVNKEGYFFSGRNFYVSNNESVTVLVKMLERELIGNIPASTGGEVETAEGMKVVLPADAISGGYSGDVRVYGKYMDPTATETMLAIPGMEGQNEAGAEGILLSFGMGHIELEDGSGNELELADGVSAELTMPIPADLVGSADATIPLWYFDEAEGIWKEDGEAQLQGDKYVGSVTHFTPWNCDDFACGFYETIQVTCPETDMTGLVVRLDIQGRNFPTSVQVSSATGTIRVFIPCAEEIDLTVILPASQTAPSAEYFLGSISTGEASSGLVQVNTGCPDYTTVRGCAVDASGNPVTNGYMYLQFDNFRGAPVYFDASGCFESTIFDFEGDASQARLIAWNLDDFTSVEGPPQPFNDQVNVLSSPLVFGGGSSASPEGRLYVGGENDLFYCLDASNGNYIWSFYRENGNFGSNSSVVWNNRVYIGNTLGGAFSCLNALDGSLIWEYPYTQTDMNSPVVTEDSTIYVSEYDGNIFAFDAMSGDIRWSKWFCCGGSSSPTISGDILYIGGGLGNNLIAIDRHTGDELWDYTADDRVRSSPVVVDNTVFFSSDDQSIYALDATTGSLIWETQVDSGGSFYTSPTIDNGVLFQRTGNVISALDVDNGDILWQIENTAGVWTQVEADDGRLYAWMGASAETIGLRGYNGQTGQEVLNKLYGARPNVSTIANGVMYHGAAGIDETITATDILTGETLWTSNVEDRLTAAPVVVDDNGNVHYCSRSGMEQ